MRIQHALGAAFAGASLLLLAASGAQAVLITDSADLTGLPAVLEHSAYTSGWTFGAGPREVGIIDTGESVTWRSSNGSAVLGNGGYGLANNGFWTGMTCSGLNTSSGWVEYKFDDGLVSGVGAEMNYAPFFYGNATIQALDGGGAVLEQYDISTMAPIATPGCTNCAVFRGIQRPTADIAAFRILNAYAINDNAYFTRGGGGGGGGDCASQASVDAIEAKLDGSLPAIEASLVAMQAQLDDLAAELCDIVRLLTTPQGRRVAECGGETYSWNDNVDSGD